MTGNLVVVREGYRVVSDVVAGEWRLGHGFYLINDREPRYTVAPAARRRILDRLLILNHEQHAEEMRARAEDDLRLDLPVGGGETRP
ncbi:hypothetical protein Acsp04_47410 [Actinomadura sp. NBRC 104425]|uniref:hypothetical protein n=1 Tax=Actinomadura sp. NBRC 104425 TaxID=3032204 RepID=UPI0024A58047|nr:hypothetical protein [Actinomadura sp. NBRC 104425]GLZ14506.1 hypothetical protein Acsp04_47410 [Actinomadura sp. NBRC 104425]